MPVIFREQPEAQGGWKEVGREEEEEVGEVTRGQIMLGLVSHFTLSKTRRALEEFCEKACYDLIYVLTP